MESLSKKIVIIGPAHPLRGGLATFNERLARAFMAEGHNVHLVTFSLQYPAVLFPGKTQFTTDPAPTDLSIEVSINSINPFNWLKIGRKIRQMSPDLVICRFWMPFMGPCLGSILRLIRQDKRIEIVGLIDNIIPHEKRIGDRPLAQYFVDACHRFVVMSRAVATEMMSFTDRKCTYTPHPIYDNFGDIEPRATALKALNLPDTPRYLLFFGFIRAYKGLDLLLKALAEPILQGLNLKLLVAGEFYEEEQKYRDLIQSLNLTDAVNIVSDFIPNEAVRHYFCAADLIVQPYKTATQSGISQMAYHFEKPMVVTNVGGLAEIVPHNEAGYVVEPKPKAIAQAIADFFLQNKATAFGASVKYHKKRFDWSAMTAVFLNKID